MRREERRFWLPLVRLSAFFFAFVIVGNLFLEAFSCPAALVPQGPQKSDSSFPQKMKRFQQRVLRTLARFIDTSASACSTEQELTKGGVPISSEVRISVSSANTSLPMGLPSEALAIPELQVAPFAWPIRMAWTAEPSDSLPKGRDFLEGAGFRAALVTDVYRRRGSDPVADIGDALLEGPVMLFDGFSTCMNRLAGRSAVRTWEDEESRGVTARLLDIQSGPRPERLFTVLATQWTERERRYLSAFDESRADTVGFQNRTEGANLHELVGDQRKIFWDVLRRTYLSQYKMMSEEQIHEEAWYFGRWSGIDFAVLPPLIMGYLYYRGIDKKIRLGDTELRITFEPVSQFVHRTHDRSAATALEWSVKGLPVGIIVSAGLFEGRYGMDFVGIGTSIAAVRGAIDLQHEVSPR